MKGIALSAGEISRIVDLWRELNNPELIQERLGLTIRSINKYKPEDMKRGGANHKRRRYRRGD